MAQQYISQGIILMIFASLFFALMGAEAKILSNHLPPIEVAFCRSSAMVLLLLPTMFRPIKLSHHKSGGWWFLTMRAITGGVSFLAFFYNIATIPLGTATAFAQSMPLYIVLLSFFFLKEPIKLNVALATIIGFVGILLICNPTLNNLKIENIIFGILSALGIAIAFLNLQALKHYFNTSFVIIFTGVVMSILSFGAMALEIPYFDDTWIMPTGFMWVHIFLLGLFGTIGQHFLTRAYMSAPAGIISPIDYTRLVFSLIIGIMLGDALPNLSTTAGTILIILSGIGIGIPLFLADLKAYRTLKSFKQSRVESNQPKTKDK